MAAAPEDWRKGPVWVGVKDIVAGSVGGGWLTVVGYPFDTIKIRQQAGTTTMSTLEVARSTLRNEGPRGFFKGMASPLAGQLFGCAACFFSYGQAKYALRPADYREGQYLSLGRIALAGGFCGFVLSFIEGPLDLFKIKMQMQKGAASDLTRYKSSADAARHIFRQHGWRGVTQGLGATILRNTLANSAYFVWYEAVRQALVPEGQATPPLISMLAGSAAGVGYWVLGLPADVVKSVVQADTMEARKYNGVADAARSLYRANGLAAFARGWVPCMLRSAPSNAALFFGFDLAQATFTRFDL